MTRINLEYYPTIEPLNDLVTAKFRQMTNITAQKWFVTEMVDGIHLAFYADAAKQSFEVATRNRFLRTGDSWYEWEATAALHRNWLMQLSKSLSRPIIVYGMLVGGRYGAQHHGVHVNTVCQYCTHNDFIMHDIKVKEGFISITELQRIGEKFQVNVAPILYEGEFNKVLGYPENKLSVIPFIHELKPNYNNEMKGIIIRPNYHLMYGGRSIMLKKLNRKYTAVKTTYIVNTSQTTLVEIAGYIDMQATKSNMIDKVLYDVGSFSLNEIPKIAGQYVTHMLDNINYVKYNLLNKAEKRLVHKELNRIAVKKLNILLEVKVKTA